MEFVTRLPSTLRGHDAIWVIVDRLTKSTHFIPTSIDFPVSKLAEIYFRVIVKLQGVPSSIVSDTNLRLLVSDTNLRVTSTFWKSL